MGSRIPIGDSLTPRVSLNPTPALVILLGLMMSSHYQDSMVSTMVHKQWGNLLVGFALAGGATYIMLYIKPPTSYLPTRPPTEIIASFCLIGGGLIFMLSASISKANKCNSSQANYLPTDLHHCEGDRILRIGRHVQFHCGCGFHSFYHGLRYLVHRS